MTKEEKALFEKDIQSDQRLKAAAISHILGSSAPEGEAREALSRIRRQKGPLPTPALRLSDRLLYFWYERKKVLFLAAGLLIAGLAALFLLRKPATEDLIRAYMVQPDCGNYAGGAESPDKDLKRLAADLYCGVSPGGTEALAALSGDSFNIAGFYLAHDYLRKEKFDRAVSQLSLCVQNKTILLNYDTGYPLMAEYNLLLARLCQGAPRAEIRSDLEVYLEKYPNHRKAADLKVLLEN